MKYIIKYKNGSVEIIYADGIRTNGGSFNFQDVKRILPDFDIIKGGASYFVAASEVKTLLSLLDEKESIP